MQPIASKFHLFSQQSLQMFSEGFRVVVKTLVNEQLSEDQETQQTGQGFSY